jgi:hypothetical protein
MIGMSDIAPATIKVAGMFIAGLLDQTRFLQVLRKRNGMLDEVFYNVSTEDADRVCELGLVPSGAIIVVPPAPGDVAFGYFPDAAALFDDAKTADAITGIAIAGVGSSAIGAVALARDVASVSGGPVAAVVSGYGLDDVFNEGLGGWFCLRETNRLEFDIEQVNNALAKVANLPALETTILAMDAIGAGPDLATLKSLLRSAGSNRHLPKLRWLVGHSKGNLLCSSAIAELVMEGFFSAAVPELAEVDIVFFGALSALPRNVGRQHQFIGDMDALGWMNSRINIDHTLVHNSMHHTNRRIPFCMNVPAQLRSIYTNGYKN